MITWLLILKLVHRRPTYSLLLTAGNLISINIYTAGNFISINELKFHPLFVCDVNSPYTKQNKRNNLDIVNIQLDSLTVYIDT